jgi:AAA domain
MSEDTTIIETDEPSPAETAEALAELKAVAGQIETLRNGFKLSIHALCSEYRELGDSKGGSYAAARNGKMAGRNPHKMLVDYRVALDRIRQRAQLLQMDELYTDLAPVTEFIEHADKLANQRGLRRLIIVRGLSGSGKTTLLRALEKERPKQTVRFTAGMGWRSFWSALEEMLVQTGTPRRTKDADTPGLDRLMSYTSRIEVLQKRLLSWRKTVLFDELQSVSGDFLTWLKDSVNRAKDEGSALAFIVAAQDALWKKLARESPEEMRQLRHNRLYLDYTVPDLPAEVVLQVLMRRLPLTGSEKERMEAARFIAGTV